MVIAGIVTYNADPERLKKNIEAVKQQVEIVVVVDNNSDNSDEIKRLCDFYGIICKKNEENRGLGKALNQIFEYGSNLGAEWILTLDQDSVIPKNYISLASRYLDDEKNGIICCRYIEKNLGSSIHELPERKEKYRYVKRCITSAAIVKVSAYQKANGYDEDLFIDYVDFDFSIKVRQAGYNILSMNDVRMEHELGNSRWVNILGKKVRYTSHSPIREYYIARNITIYINRYKNTENVVRDFLSLLKHYLFALMFDSDRVIKIKALIKGRRDGKEYVRSHSDIHKH